MAPKLKTSHEFLSMNNIVCIVSTTFSEILPELSMKMNTCPHCMLTMDQSYKIIFGLSFGIKIFGSWII